MKSLALILALVAPRWAAAQETPPADHRVVLHFPQGDVVIALYPQAAPRHVEQFAKLARLRAYDSTPVVYVKDGYLIQFASIAGRRLRPSPEQLAAARRLPLEAGLRHTKGALTMSRRPDDPDSAESSFSILLRDAPHLDRKYTVFGKVERGWEALEAIAAAPRLSNGQPVHWVEITRAQVVPSAELESNLAKWKAPAPKEAPRGVLLALLGLVVALCGAAAALGKFYARLSRAACLLAALAAFFAALTAYAPRLPMKGWVPVALFAAALALFKLMSRFEEAGG